MICLFGEGKEAMLVSLCLFQTHSYSYSAFCRPVRLVAGDKLEVVLRNLTEQLSAFLRRATDFLHSKYMRRTLFAFSMVSVLIGLLVFVSPVHAQGTLSDIANGVINAVSYILIEIAGIFMQITIFALKFFIEIAGYNNFIDASIVKLGWNMVRDVANMFFVVILLVIAFGTILGLEQYEWKKTLAKLIMSAFLVNFSNLICQVIIDVSQVFTITFLNAIAGAAGGNLIKMFNFDEILQIAQRGTDPSGIQIELFGGAVMTIIFSGMAMATIGAYLVVMVARMVVLWTLMIMSPLAFLFAALPNTQSHAQEFWNQFTSQVIVAPVMVFFLWLAFATFGGGDIVQQDIEANHPLIADGGIRAVTESTDVNGNSLGITFSKAASWENMANFAVAIAFLWIGLERVQKLGVVGGGLVSGAMSFGKNVATIASGVALGRWMGRKGVEGAKAGMTLAGKGLYQGLAANRVEIIKNAIDRQIEGWGDWRGRGADPLLEDKRVQAVGSLDAQTLAEIKANGGQAKDGQTGVDSSGAKVRYDASRGNWYQHDENDADGKWKRERNKKTGEVVKDFARDKNGMPMLGPNTNNAVQKFFHGRQMALIASRKNLEKVKNQKKVREDLMDKRVTAVPKYLMQAFEGKQPDAFDRMEQGMLEAEQMRSAAKTEEFKALGKSLILNSQREKDGQRQEGDTIAQQIAGHKTRAALNEGLAQKVQSTARRDYIRDKGKDVVRATMDAKLEVEASDAESKKLEASAMTGAILASERLGDKGALAQKIAAEKAEHSETVKQGLIEKREEKRFLEGGHGQTEVREEAAFKAEMAATEAAIKRIEEQGEIDAMADVKKSGIANPFKQKIQEELEAARVAEQKKTAEAELSRNVKENEGKDTLVATQVAKTKTAAEEALSKQFEAEAAKVAAELNPDAVNVTAAADLAAQTAQAEAKKITAQAEKDARTSSTGAVVLSRQQKAALQTERMEAEKKQAEAESKAAVAKSTIGQTNLEATQAAQLAAQAADTVLKQEQSKAKRRFMRRDTGKAVLRDLKTAELGNQAAETEVKEEEAIAGREVAGSTVGKGYLRRKKKAETSGKAEDSEREQIEADIAAAFAESVEGLKFLERINLSEQGKLAADNFVKNISEADIAKKFELAGKAIELAAKKGAKALEKLASENTYVRAMRSVKVLASNQEENKVLRDEAEAQAEAHYVDKGVKGYSATSSSLVAMAKRTADELNGYTNEALGKALTDNLAFVASMTKNGKKLSLKQKMALFGTTNKVNSEAYIDDTFFQMIKRLNLKQQGKIKDPNELKALEDLEDIWVNKLKVIKKTKSGYKGNYGEEVTAVMQNYAISGGNIEYVQQHQAIEANMKANPGKSYTKAMEDVLGAKKDEFLEQMDELELFTKEAASSFKNQALAAGHRQLGGHQIFDSELGRHRFATQEESRAVMQGEMRKRGSKVNYQYHSLGEINEEGIMVSVDMEHFRDTVGQAKKYLDIKSVQDRTRDAALGYKPSEEKVVVDGYGVLGASADEVEKRFGGIDNFIKNVLIPQLAGGAKAVGLMAQLKFDNVTAQDAESGKLKVAIAGTSIKADNIASLIEQVKNHFGSNLSSAIDAKVLKELDAAQSAAIELLNTNSSRGQKSTIPSTPGSRPKQKLKITRRGTQRGAPSTSPIASTDDEDDQ